jgi:hypothetical protein
MAGLHDHVFAVLLRKSGPRGRCLRRDGTRSIAASNALLFIAAQVAGGLQAQAIVTCAYGDEHVKKVPGEMTSVSRDLNAAEVRKEINEYEFH